ncbi:unnamed protein product [marine sediment metagenome]|uniref:Uncharacterized protein n=1 Tax=marine sediment metagenome TaxID=412755 RepID=X1CLK2_9ZZZZ
MLEKLGTPQSKIERVKKALKSGLKDGVKEVGKIALGVLIRIVTGIS